MSGMDELTRTELEMESALRAMRPAATALDFEDMIFRAGQASARRRVRFWQGVALLVLVVAGGSWFLPRPRAAVEPPAPARVDTPREEAEPRRLAVLEYRVDGEWRQLSQD